MRAQPSDLSLGQRSSLTLAVLVLHVVVGTWVWRTSSAPVTPTEQAPLMVSLITESVAETLPLTPPVVQPTKPQPTPQPSAPPPPQRVAAPVLASARPAQPQDAVVPVAAPEPRVAPSIATPTAPVQTSTTTTSTAPTTALATEPSVPATPKALAPSEVRLLTKIKADYPPASLELGESGTVSLLVVVDEHGRVKDVQVSKPSGYSRLDRSAVTAMRAARFQPYLEGGVPRSFSVTQPIVFNPIER